MNEIQKLISSTDSKIISLDKKEYLGPLVIDRPCIIDGNDAIIFANKGPVINVKSNDVIIKNLHVEVMDENLPIFEKIAIQSDYKDLRLMNVVVVGEVNGLEDSQIWGLPSRIDLGMVKVSNYDSVAISLKAASKALVINKVPGTRLTPEFLNPGENKLNLKFVKRLDDDAIFGRIHIQTGGVLREITITGKVKS